MFKQLTFFFAVLLFNGTAGRAQVVLTDTTGIITLGKQFEVLQPVTEITLTEALRNREFRPATQDVVNLGTIPGSAWLRFSVLNKSSDGHFLLEVAYPILDEVELFVQDDHNRYTPVTLGEDKPFTQRKYAHPSYIFDLDVPRNITKTYYLRIKSAEQVIVPTTISRPTGLWEKLNRENLITGIYLGIVLIMVLYNLFIFFSVRDKSYLYYVLYVVFAGLTQVGIKGYTFQYLWPGNTAFEVKSVILFACLSGMGALLFTKDFLHTRENARKTNYVLTALVGLFGIGILLTSFGQEQPGFKVMQGTTTLLTVTVLSVSFMIMRQGYAPAKFFFSAWSVLLGGAIIFLLKDYGVLPYNTFTSYSMQAASAIEMALLSFGLADRINTLKKEKEASQAEALATAKENERIIREQNVMLEEKVQERTHELKQTNQSLSVTLEDLKQTQSQLVESEKMASLGQLTAGIAHEINNPINFVTSNVNPLRRDVDILLDAIAAIEKVGISDSSAEDKIREIEAYKEELDFDYLKTEISHLLKGIHEGASRTAEIVKGLRVFSRLDENDLKKADINEGIDSTLVIINNLLNNRIGVVKEFGNLPLIECYPGKLNQVFLNILTNAIHAVNKKFGEQAGGMLHITTIHEGDHVLIRFRDNGTGMDENTRKKIYEPFFTTKDVGEGTGLGMSISYNTIRKHNGQIRLESAPGQGTEFTIELPVIHRVKQPN
ncbi:sensor histidine kinase [Hufsiella ginkgonis]|uniref:histidine kinase n=1 Tax=Hufsiella ginkgonis TaxID=2695274 RepID=A0A7K1XTS4_9SPHI|nr:7TM diverse intracellular signaling domain-containing protein [Hufsiella ginkgonis]MXV14382.1 histidine kinase [Hufsiella ginkgonis]